MDRPERAVFASPHDVIWGTDLDGPRPYGVVYWDAALNAFLCLLRGTDSRAEWISDADSVLMPCPFLAGARTHRGFTRIHSSMVCEKRTLSDYLRSTLHDRPDRNLIVAGHSLGAALATLAAVQADGADLVTWAGPRVGDDHFVELAGPRLASNTRIVNIQDIVPGVPLRLFPAFPYRHLGNAMEFNSLGRVRDVPAAWHSLTTYMHLIDPQQPVDAEFILPPS